MNIVTLGFKNLKVKKLSTFLSVLLVTFGIAIISSLLILSNQLSNNLEKNAENIDAVVGAKGSPMQLILSSIYYVDFPTGNIPYEDALRIARNPMVKMAVPLALGDNFKGYRIVGTDQSFTKLYNLRTREGKFWEKDFEVTVGAEVAKKHKLQIGQTIQGAHGLSSDEDLHDDHEYKIVGILEAQDRVVDHLVLTNISSVWHMHGIGEEHHEHNESEEHEHHESLEGKDITSLLIQYKSPLSVITFPKLINESTFMQAASPAMESARLFSLVGVGMDALTWFAYLIILISAISVFVNLYNSLKERKFDLAIMRTLGASRFKVFFLVIFEGIIITVIGALLGIVLGHGFVELIGSYQEDGQHVFTGLIFYKEEFYLLGLGLVLGVLASIIPALQAYNTDISKVLADK